MPPPPLKSSVLSACPFYSPHRPLSATLNPSMPQVMACAPLLDHPMPPMRAAGREAMHVHAPS